MRGEAAPGCSSQRARQRARIVLGESPPLFPIDKHGGGCDGEAPLWELISIRGPESLIRDLGRVGYLTPWFPGSHSPVGHRWWWRVDVPLGGGLVWHNAQLFERGCLVQRRLHVLYIKGALVQAVFWRIG